MRDRNAFTIVEVLVTIVVLSVGLLGFASTTAAVARMTVAGRRFTEATTLAGRHLAAFQSGACDGPGTGESVQGPFHLSWTASRITERTASVTVVVTSSVGVRTYVDTLWATNGC